MMTKIKNKQSTKEDTRYLLTGSLIVAFMLFIPYVFYIYDSLPDIKTYKIGNYTFISNYYESVRYFFHALLSKSIPLILLIIWFITCKHWWYYSIAIPIAVYVFQLGGVLNDDIVFNDTYEFIYSLPFTIIIVSLLLLVRSKISVFLKAVDLKAQLDEKMDAAIEKRRKVREEIMEE